MAEKTWPVTCPHCGVDLIQDPPFSTIEVTYTWEISANGELYGGVDPMHADPSYMVCPECNNEIFPEE